MCDPWTVCPVCHFCGPRVFFLRKKEYGPRGRGLGTHFSFRWNNQVAYKLVLQFEDLC